MTYDTYAYLNTGRANSLNLPVALSYACLMRSANVLTGIVQNVNLLTSEPTDVPGLFNAAVSADLANSWQTTSGAIATTKEIAQCAALGEAFERYAAARCAFPVRQRGDLISSHAAIIDAQYNYPYSKNQRQQSNFPWRKQISDDDLLGQLYSLYDNHEVWLPQEWIGMGARVGESREPSTSSGLAACLDNAQAPYLGLLRALEEVLERDALTVTWLNGLGGRIIPLNSTFQEIASRIGANVHAYDLTQVWNPHPVVAVAGHWLCNGHPRYAFGISCRQNYALAMEKAWQEWAQSMSFVAYQLRQPNLPKSRPQDLKTFNEHAMFYTWYPDLWQSVPFIANQHTYQPEISLHQQAELSCSVQLEQLIKTLHQQNIDIFYRELTTVDVAKAGVRVFRVLSPSLATLHADERVPFLGGRCDDYFWRYPLLKRHSAFPNPLPHPLG